MNRAKTLVAMAVMAACAWPLAGNAQSGTSGTSDASGSSGGTYSGTTGNQGSPAMQRSAPGGTAAMNTTDSNFVAMAASGGMLEVEASKLALQKSQNAEVRNFATKMIDDHTRANRDLMAAAASAGVTNVPTMLLPRDQATLDRLRSLSGSEFDRAYSEQIGVMAHHDTVALFQQEAASGSHPALTAFAEKTLPALKGHLEQSQVVATAAGVPADRMQAYSPTLGSTTASAATPASESRYHGMTGATSSASTGMAGSRSSYSAASDATTGQAGSAWTGNGLVGPYVGGSLGMSNYSSDQCVGQCDKTDWGGKVFAGYMFTPWIGAEIDYGWFGKTTINTTTFLGATPVNSTAEIKTDGFSGFLVGQYPIDNFRPFAKVGFARLNTSVNGAINGIPLIDNNDPSFEFAWGVGLGYSIDRNFGLRAEYEARRYQWENQKNTLGFWSVGVEYRF